MEEASTEKVCSENNSENKVCDESSQNSSNEISVEPIIVQDQENMCTDEGVKIQDATEIECSKSEEKVWANDDLDDVIQSDLNKEKEEKEMLKKKEEKIMMISALCYDKDRAKFNEDPIIYADKPFNFDLGEDDLTGKWVRLTERKFDWGEFSGCYIPPSSLDKKNVTINVYDFSCRKCKERQYPVGYKIEHDGDEVIQCVWSTKSGTPVMCNQNLGIMHDIFHCMKLHDTLRFKEEINYYKHLVFIDYEDGKAVGLNIGPDCYKVKPANAMEIQVMPHMSIEGISPKERSSRNRETAKFLTIAGKRKNAMSKSEYDEFVRYEAKYMLKFGLYDKQKQLRAEFDIEAHLKIVYQRIVIMLRYFKYYFQGYINLRTSPAAIVFKKDIRNPSLNLLEYDKSKDSTMTPTGHVPDVKCKTRIINSEETEPKQVFENVEPVQKPQCAWNNFSEIVKPEKVDEQPFFEEPEVTSISNMIKDIQIYRGTRMHVLETGKKMNTVLGPLPVIMPCESTKLVIIELQRAHQFPVGYKIEFDVLFDQAPLACYKIIICYVLRLHEELFATGILTRDGFSPLLHNVSTFTASKIDEVVGVAKSFTMPIGSNFDVIQSHILNDHKEVNKVRVPCDCICELINKQGAPINFCRFCIEKKVSIDFMNNEKYTKEPKSRGRDAFLRFFLKLKDTVEFERNIDDVLTQIKRHADDGLIHKSLLKCLILLRDVLTQGKEVCRTCAGFLFAIISGFAFYENILTPYVPVQEVHTREPRTMTKVSTWTILGGLFQLSSISCNMPKLNIDSQDQYWGRYVATKNITYNDPACLAALLIRHVMSKLDQGQTMRLSAFNNDRIVIFSDDKMSKEELIWNVFGAATGMWKTLIKFCMKSIDVIVAGTSVSGFWSESKCSLRLPLFDNLYPRVDKAIVVELGKTSADMLSRKHKSVYIPKVTFHIYDMKEVQRYNVTNGGLNELSAKFNLVMELKDKKLAAGISAVPNAKGTGLIFKYKDQNDEKTVTSDFTILKDTFNKYMMEHVAEDMKISLLDIISYVIMNDLAISTLDLPSFKLNVICKIGKTVFYYPIDEIKIVRKEMDDSAKITVREKPKAPDMRLVESVLYKKMMD